MAILTFRLDYFSNRVLHLKSLRRKNTVHSIFRARQNVALRKVRISYDNDQRKYFGYER